MIGTWLKRSLIALAVLAAALLIYVGSVLLLARGGLPEWSGEHRVAGVDGPIEILRDEHGVSHILAESEADAHFALGFVHAQDRLWQMMFNRQRLQGRLAEWMGALALDADILQREAFYPPSVARRQWEALPPETRRMLRAYADGVNAYLESTAYRRPPEMRILHVAHEPWRAEDALVMWSQLYPGLIVPGFESSDQRLRLYASADHAVELNETRLEGPPIVEQWPPVPSSAGDGGADRTMGSPTPVTPTKRGAFSNGWVVSGEHTTSGRPLLANDPQLGSMIPGTWYLVHLSIDGRSVVGASIPGIPGVIVGRTDHLAWGATNATVDALDLALVALDTDDPLRYRAGGDGAWERFEIEKQRYRVRFGEDVERPLRWVGASVVFPDDRSTVPFAPDGAATLFRSVGWGTEHSLTALLDLNRAQSVEEGLAAGRKQLAPAMNLSMADTAGRIAYVTAGRIADRPIEHAGRVDFAPDDHNDWRGLVPAAENPSIIDPPSGRIVSANQVIVDEAYPHYLADRWAPPYRAIRIHHMLDRRARHDADDFVEMQSDTLSPPAVEMLPALLEVEPVDADARRLLDLLAGWDGRFDPDVVAPVVFTTWLELFQRAALFDELGSTLAPRYAGWLMLPMLQALLEGKEVHWCDDVTTSDRAESCDELLSATLSATHQRMVEVLGERPEAWTWREAAEFTHPHLGFAGLPLLDGWFSRSSDVGGGPETAFIHFVNTSDAPRFTRHMFASTLQLVFDLDDLDDSRYVIAGGQSGHFRSEHYDDLVRRWERGERIRIPTGRDAIEAESRLVLLPMGAD